MDNFRNLLGEDLDSLDIKELEHLEKQLDSSLKHIRSTRVLTNSLSLMILLFQVDCLNCIFFVNWSM